MRVIASVFLALAAQASAYAPATVDELQLAIKDYFDVPQVLPTDMSSIEDWDITALTDLSRAFFMITSADLATVDLSGWDTSGITKMFGTFRGATTFQGIGVGSWNMTSVTNVASMFEGATSFEQPLRDWDLQSAVNFNKMFLGATSFTGTGLDNWQGFIADNFISSMSHMFDGCTSFDGSSIVNWDVAEVKKMDYMFANNPIINVDLSRWTFDRVESMVGMFENSVSFDQDLCAWGYQMMDISPGGAGINFEDMFKGTSCERSSTPLYDSDKEIFVRFCGRCLVNKNVTGCQFSDTSTPSLPDAVTSYYTTPGEFDGSLSRWCVSGVTDFTGTFKGIRDRGLEKLDLSGWDVSAGEKFNSMFFGASGYLGIGIEEWDVSSMKVGFNMFRGADSFDVPLNKWNVTSLKNAVGMFREAESYTGKGLKQWNQYLKDDSFFSTKFMFRGTNKLDGDEIDEWDMKQITITQGMFQDNIGFNTDISSWNLAKITDAKDMFKGASAFNQDLCAWSPNFVGLSASKVGNMFAGTACPEKGDPDVTAETPYCFVC